MPVSRTDITTPNAVRYLDRLCGHAGKMTGTNLALRIPHRPRMHVSGAARPRIQRVDRTGDRAVLILDCGQVTLHARPGSLSITADAGQASLEPVQDLIAGRLRTFASREQLTITWQLADPGPGA